MAKHIGSLDIRKDLRVRGRVENNLLVRDEVVAEAFYLNSGWDLTQSTVQFDVATVAVDNYFIYNFADQAFKVESVQIISSTGSATVAFYIHGDGERTPGVSIAGLDPISVSATKVSAIATGENEVDAGDSIVLSVPTNTGATHIRGRLVVSTLR